MTTASVTLLLASLTVLANGFVVLTVALVVARRWGWGRAWFERWRDLVSPNALDVAWIVAAVSTAGSLFYSEVANFTPCTLCWYQRIAMYPLVVVLGIAAWRRDLDVRRYVVPLAGAGALISAYHYQLERFPGQASVACSADCTVVWVWRFHYISIPFMALSAFLLIAVLLVLARRPATESELPSSREPVLGRSM